MRMSKGLGFRLQGEFTGVETDNYYDIYIYIYVHIYGPYIRASSWLGALGKNLGVAAGPCLVFDNYL